MGRTNFMLTYFLCFITSSKKKRLYRDFRYEVVAMQILCLLGGWLFFSIAYGSRVGDEVLEKHTHSPFQEMKTDRMKKTLFVRLQHAEAEQVAKILEKKTTGDNILSKSGYMAVDKVTNALWIADFPAQLNSIEQFIHAIDIPVKQIILQAYIVNVDQHFTKELGIDFSGQPAAPESTQGALKQIMPRAAIQKGRFNIVLTHFGSGSALEVELAALESQGRGRILSSPRLITSSGKPAYIGSGDEIPYQERTSHGNTNVAFKKAVLSLEVTPQWLSKNILTLDLVVHQDKTSAMFVNGVPAIHTQEVRTQVRVKDGQTIVLGGIFEQVNNKQHAKLPLLGNLPLIGGLFRHNINKQDRRELLIFITPKIVL